MVPQISIVTPFKNAAAYLPEAIHAVRQNTFQSWEWLCVSDNADAGSRAILRQAAHEDQRIKLLDSPGPGIVRALNFGMARACTDIIFRLDADDICHPARFAEQKAFLDAHPGISLVSCLVEPIWEMPYNDGFNQYIQWVNGCATHADISHGLLIESPLPHPSVAFRKIVTQMLGGYRDFEGPEDYDFWLRMKEARLKFQKVDDVLLKWRIRRNSLSRTHVRYSNKAFERLKFAHLLRIYPSLPTQKKQIYVWGAGKLGGRLAGTLLANKIPVKGFIDIDSKKTRAKRHGLPVCMPDAIPPNNQKKIYISYVSTWHAREIIRSHLERKGYLQGRDFLIL